MSAASVIAIEGVMRHYEWGSRSAIPQMLGIEPNGRPVAELWFGAHPDDPSPATGDDHRSLDELIAADPEAMLGADSVRRFGPRLPYLLKVLAADTVLSMQVHPSRPQAELGFAREEAAGIAPDAAHRTYHDPHHKPELLCALTPFEALCGFRPVAQTIALLDSLRLPELARLRDTLGGGDGLRAAFTYLLTLSDPAPLVSAVVSAAQPHAEDPLSPLRPVAIAAADFPGDIGAVLGLLLNYVRLDPGDAIYLAAGNVHAYLRGTGIEVMANSDNVLRCGLTPKHVDVAELLRVTDFSELAEPRWPDVGGRFSVPVPDFALARLELEPTGVASGASTIRTALDDPGPALVLCTSGSLTVGGVDLHPGRAAFVPAGVATVIAGAGQAFVATVGDG